MQHSKKLPVVAAWLLSFPSWMGIAAVVYCIATAIAQWDEDIERPFRLILIFGTYACGSISALLATYLLWTQRRWVLFCWCILPLAIVTTLFIIGYTLKYRQTGYL